MDIFSCAIVVAKYKNLNAEKMYIMCRIFDLSYVILATDNTYI
jgi:hypothetical protein